MNSTVLVKVYAHLEPSAHTLAKVLDEILQQCIGEPENIHFCCTAAAIEIRFEGIFFPLEEVIYCIKEHAPELLRGKIDYIDIENWQLIRHVVQGTRVIASQADLNHVLDHSGF